MIEGTKILVVDDNPEVINILGDFLGLNGCEIYKATCGREALEMLEKKDPR
jgi:CheY-like chemotaxis protein